MNPAALLIAAALLVSFSVVCSSVNVQNDLVTQDILKAVQEEDMGRLEWILTEGVNPDFFNENGDRWTPLIFAVNKGKLDFVDRLLKGHANPNLAERDGWTPLHFSAAFGHIAIARALIEAGADVAIKTSAGKTAVDLAKEYKKWDVLETLEVAKRTNIPAQRAREQYLANLNGFQHPDTSARGMDALNLFMKFAESGPTRDLQNMLITKTVNVNAKTADGRTALHRAAFSGNMERIQILIGAGAYVNELDTQSWSALMFAAANAHYDASQYLLSLGADPFIRNIHGISAYVLAAENGHPEISSLITSSGLIAALLGNDEVKMLQMIRAGADPDSEGANGFTVLLHFAGRGNVDAVQEIVRLGADVNVQEQDKWSALMFASFRGDIQTVITLMNNGADQTLRNKAGKTALDLAIAEGHTAVVEIIKSYRTKNLRTQPRRKN